MTTVSTGGGGGGHSNGGNGGSNTSVNGSDGAYFGGGGGGAGINSVAPGGNGGDAGPTQAFVGGSESSGNGGGGAGASQNGFSATGTGSSGTPGNGGNGIGTDSLFGGGGGGGAASETGFPGGTGVGAARGGGGSNYSGGTGGTLGGGGGGGIGGNGGGGGGIGGNGGEGGFGAGGGGALTRGIGGGAGGVNGASDPNCNGGGGGGSGLGGAIFIQSGANLTIVDAAQISGNTSIAGLGGSSTSTSDPNYIAPGDGAAMGYDIFMCEQGSITFDLSNTLTIATPIEGDQTSGPNTTGGLKKIGEGTLKLNGANTYSGTTTVDGGILNLNGSVTGSAIIGTEGTLSGNATVSGDLTNSGILAPGNSIGTINTTNLILTPSSLLEIEVASNGTNDLLAATGTAQINGTLEVIPLPGSFLDVQSYTIPNATDGITGIFSFVESSVPSLLEVIYNPTSVVVRALPIESLGLDSNAEAAASSYLSDGLITGSDLEAVNAALLTLDADEINDSFNQMQPSQFSGLAWSQIENLLLVRSGYYQRLEKMNCSSSCRHNPRIWGEMIGAHQKQNSNGQQFGYTDWTAGTTIGLDAVCCDEFRLGIAASYTYSRLNWSKSAGHANVNSYYGGYYTNWSNKCGYVNATLLGAYCSYQSHRHMHFATIDRRAKSTHNGWAGLAGLEAGLNFGYDRGMQIIPFIGTDYIYLSQREFVEKGADSSNLDVDSKQNQIIQSELGIIWTGYICRNSCAPGSFVPLIKLSYINDTPLSNRHLNGSFVDSDNHFRVRGLCFRRNLGAASLGLTYLNCDDTFGMTVHYDGQFGSNYYNQAANITLDIQF